jgi:predicted 3-demethylubiquinone-9 3-methyltransferase (glyoxalase superfamily)
MIQQTALGICLWFERDGLAAAGFYTRLIPNGALETAVLDFAYHSPCAEITHDHTHRHSRLRTGLA